MIVVFFSDIRWHDLHQRPQHIATALAREWRVLWVEPTTLLKKTHFEPIQVEENIYVVSIPAIPYNARFRFVQAVAKPLSRICIFRSVVEALQTAILKRGIARIARGGEPVGVFVNYFHCVGVAERLRPEFIQFDYIDNAFGFTSMPPHVMEYWKRMIAISSFVTVTSEKLADQIRPLRAKDIHLAGNGVEYERFANPGDVARPADLPEGKPIVCYTGAVYPWLDYELVDYVAGVMKEINFVFIGPAHPDVIPVIDGLKAKGNVFHLGFRPYATLPGYLRHVDVGIIPFRRNELTMSVNPVKLYEYCAAGKPTVATRFADELLPLGNLVTFAGSRGEFVAGIRQALVKAKDQDHVSALRALAKDHDWEKTTSRIIGLIRKYLKE